MLQKNKITERLDAVEEIKNNLQLLEELRTKLRGVFDLERLGSKISMGQCNARDLIALKRSLASLPDIMHLLVQQSCALFKYPDDITLLEDIANLIENSIRDDSPATITEGAIIKDGYNKELDELIEISRDGKKWLAELSAKEKKKTGLSSLKIKYNKVFGYFIEVSRVQSKSVPVHYIRKQTLVNAERFITDELKIFESKILGAEDKRGILEYKIFNDIRQAVSEKCDNILSTANFIAKIDCIANLAEIAVQNNYYCPEINSKGVIKITNGRHPVVEKMISGERYVPNSIKLDNKINQIMIITGPNMAGKSTVLRQVALISILAQIGSFVPADSASISISDRIFTRVGALDNLSQGQSTFMVEMEETANIINNATPQSLVIMDEIGRGTSTYDGLSIAWAVANHLHDLNGKGVKTLFATHYHELTKLEKIKARVKNYNIAVKEFKDNIIFLRKLIEGGTNKSYGIQVARLAGIPDTVIEDAKRILNKIETGERLTKEDVYKKNGKSKKIKKTEIQLSLFPSEDKFINKLCNIDLMKMTPLDALNCLNKLKEDALKAKK
ncbi:MAG: DNA mismatch repair protein MutS [Desulfobacteraceae bacterium 4572_19]|nr:MAG: DNA mismatch repair protein MutS [Desulfobacteraceae bacterium 4572_19]